MQIKRRVKVLIVDDSLLFREALARGIGEDSAIEVVGTAADPYEARDKILELEPDVLTLDVEMPRMNGIDFLKKLIPQYPLPVIMVSAVSERVFDALHAGAVDYVSKSDTVSGRGLDVLIRELVVKIKVASSARLTPALITDSLHPVLPRTAEQGRSKSIIAIGASTGGTEAIYKILKKFPVDMPGTVIVQHMPPVFTGLYAERLNRECTVEVKEAKTGDRILPGRVLIAPGDSHIRIKKIGSGYMVEQVYGDRVNGHCPSVDVLFYSVAQQAGKDSIGVILTGMGNDGAAGLLAMRTAGAQTIGQDETSCVVYGMPKVAFETGSVQEQMPLERIAARLSLIAFGRAR